MWQAGGGTLLALATYTYDVNGNLLEEDEYTQAAGVTTITRHAYDGTNAWADFDGTNTLQMRRVYLPGADQMLARVDAGGNLAWYGTDHLGSVRDVINAAGTMVLDQISYDAYGNVTNETNAANGDAYKYDGYTWDSGTGLYKSGPRDLNPLTGTWNQEDQSQFRGSGPNLYDYVLNDPTNYTDPSGLVPQELDAVTISPGTLGAFDNELLDMEKNKAISHNQAQSTRDDVEKLFNVDTGDRNDAAKTFLYNVTKEKDKKGNIVIQASFEDMVQFKAPKGAKVGCRIVQTGKLTLDTVAVNGKKVSKELAHWVEDWYTKDGAAKALDIHQIKQQSFSTKEIEKVIFTAQFTVGVGQYKDGNTPGDQTTPGYYDMWNNGNADDVKWFGKQTTYQVIAEFNSKGEWHYQDTSIKLDKKGTFNKLD